MQVHKKVSFSGTDPYCSRQTRWVRWPNQPICGHQPASTARRHRENQIKARCQLDAFSPRGKKVGQHQRPSVQGNPAEQKVGGVPGLVADIELGGEAALPSGKNREVNVRGAAGIRHRPYGAKAVAAIGVGDRVAEALKVWIPFVARIQGVVIVPVGIALPDFDARGRDRPAIGIEQPAAQVGDAPSGDAVSAPHAGQIVIVLGRGLGRVERASALGRGGCYTIYR